MLQALGKQFPFWLKLITSLCMIFLVAISGTVLASRQGPDPNIDVYARLLSIVHKQGRVSVIVGFGVPEWPQGMPDDLRLILQEGDAIQKAQDELLAEVGSTHYTVEPVYWSIPLVNLDVDEQGLLKLMNSPRVTSLVPNQSDLYYSGFTISSGTAPAPYPGGAVTP